MNLNINKVQQYLDWLKTKIYLDGISTNAKNRIVKRGQVYWCYFGIGVGSEMSKSRPRPCVILQNNKANYYSPNTIVAPITHDEDEYPSMVAIPDYFNQKGDIVLDGKVNLANITCISKARLKDRIDDKDGAIILNMTDIDEALAGSIGIIWYYKKLKEKLLKRDARIEELVNRSNHFENLLNDVCRELDIKDNSLIIDKVRELQKTVDNN